MLRKVFLLVVSIWAKHGSGSKSNTEPSKCLKPDANCPNIVIFITDDQDVQLRSEEIMEKTRRVLIERGVRFANAFTTTPTCCPSRSSLLTGLYAHNHGIMTNNGNCTGEQWKRVHEKNTYAVKLQELGYTTAFFGKYLNEYDGSYIPQGWNRWFGLLKNSKYYNYKIATGTCDPGEKECEPREEKYEDSDDDYLTTKITQKAHKFFLKHKQKHPDRPVLMVLNYPAPHGPEDAEQKYTDSLAPGGDKYDKFKHLLKAHRNDTFNRIDKAPGSKHWFLRYMETMSDNAIKYTDFLQRKRLQTLFSVDDSVEKIIELTDRIDADNTYHVYTSDHGYHLGQFGVVKGKALPYDFDTRIPFYISGPGIPENITRNQIVLNIDLMPTLLEMTGMKKWAKNQEERLDGTSFLPVAKGDDVPWRTYFLIERGKMPNKILNPKPNKQNYLKQLCQRPEMANPNNKECPAQKGHYCLTQTDPQGNTLYKIAKCSRDRSGLMMKNGECCCHGCLRKNENNKCSHNHRYKRAAFDPRAQPLVTSCLTDRNCTCVSSSRSANTGGQKGHNKPKTAYAKMINKIKADKQKYEEKKNEITKVEKRKGYRKPTTCGKRGLACFTVTQQSFLTEPRWHGEDDCFCSNASNGTFFCIRGISETENYLYCEFLTNDIEYYDLRDGQQPTINLYSVPDDAYENQQNTTQKKVEELKRIKDTMFACQGAKCKPEQTNQLRNKQTRHKTGSGRGNGRLRQTSQLVPSDSGSRPFSRRIKPNRDRRRGERQRHKSNKMTKASSQPAYVPIMFAKKHF